MMFFVEFNKDFNVLLLFVLYFLKLISMKKINELFFGDMYRNKYFCRAETKNNPKSSFYFRTILFWEMN